MVDESTNLIMKRYSIILFVLILTTIVLSACGGKGPLPPADTTPPSVISVNPANGAQNVPINSSVIITFNEAMDASSINAQTISVSTGNSNVQGSVTYSGGIAIFKPTSNLNPTTIYTVAVEAGVKDAAGNSMGSPYGYIFITGINVQQDITPPRVVDVQPSNRTTDVSRNTVIVVMFNEQMDPSTITNTTIKISTLAVPDIPCTVTLFGSAAIIKSTLDFASSTVVTVVVTTRVKDLAGNAMTDAFVSSFKTGTGNDTNSPSVLIGLSIPASGGTTVSVNTPISVTFSKPMNVSTINLSTFIVSDGTSTVPGDLQYFGTSVIFTPSTSLLSSMTYTITVKKMVADLSGNTMSDDYTWSFTTEPQAPDTSPPQILSTYPTLNQITVPVYRNVVVLFNEKMLVSSITQTTFSLADSLGALVPGTITSNGAMVTFTSAQPLAYSTTYTATMTTAATDIAGNQLTSNYSWGFTTESIAAFTITPSAGAHGSISPNTVQTVTYGATPSFTITPASGYHVADVSVDGSSVGQVSSYSFAGVTADHTITASFAINTYTITTTPGASGTITPANPSVNSGGSQTLTITPNAGYHIDTVSVDSVSLPGAPTSYTFTNVTANHTISASFAINTYTITPSAGSNGSISPNTVQTVNYGATPSFTITPATGYHVSDVLVDSVSVGALTSYTFTSVAVNHTISASFAINTYTITPSAGSNGSISPNTVQTVNYGATLSFTITPATGYHVSDVLVDGVSVGAPTSYAFTSVAANHTISATFSIKTTPTITWSNPAAITYGTALGASQLNATASVPGTFVYNPAAGVVLNAGAQNLSVTFTPTDTTNYNNATGMVSVTVNKANSNVTVWPTASTITYGLTLSASTLSGGSATPAGSFAFTTPSTVPSAGTASQGVTFTPTDTTNYNSATGTVSVTVNKANSSVTVWPTASAITYGQTLASSNLTGGSSTPVGSFAFTTPSTTPSVGTASQSVTFTPTDTNYNTVTGTVSVTVNKANSNVTVWPTASTITYGQTLAASTLSGGSATPAGSFAFTTPSTVPSAGTASQGVTFTPTDTTNYNSATGTVSVTVNKATPTIIWSTPAPILAGTQLDGTQLNATVTPAIAGNFTYTPPAGTVLDAGLGQTLSVTFTPTDSTNYNTATANVLIDVN